MSTIAREASAAAPDQRTTPRRRVMKGAKIAFGDFVFVRDCSVRDLSQDGARITVTGASEIPNEFHLVMTTDRTMRKAVVVWRKGDMLGVSFQGEPRDLATDPDPRLRQFRP